MMSGSFDHSAIWSRTKICRRNCSSLAWACETRSGSVPQDIADPFANRRAGGVRAALAGPVRLLLSTVRNGRQGVQAGDPREIVDGHPFVDRVLAAGARSVGDGRHLGQRPKAIAVVHERFRTD